MKVLCALPLALALFLVSPPASAGQSACRVTAQDLWQSCREDARQEYWTQRALCANEANAGERSECVATARDDQQDALDECDDQHDARLDLCDQVGGAPYDPVLVPGDFTADVTNPFFPLPPGMVYRYETRSEGHLEVDEVHVTQQVKTIEGVPCRVVHDVVSLDGVVTEDTLDWYSQDGDGNVWYFGEESKQYEDGELVGIDGSWKTGRNGARPGVVMEAHPQVGDAYRQEFAPADDAEDAATVASLDGAAVVPYGSYTGLLVTHDISPLEPGVVEQKLYAAGVGVVLEIDADGGRVELVSIHPE